MNTGFFARLYESPVWRPLHTRLGSGFSMEEEVRQVLDRVNKRRVTTAADLACGTGHYARAFARRWPEAEVYGLDISPGMLDRARHLAARENLDIVFLRADIHRLPFSRESLDYVNCGGTLHLLSDAAPVWEEVHRVLVPGGVFTAMVVGQGTSFLRKWQRRVAPRWGTTFFSSDQLERELTKAGFEALRCTSHRLVLLVSAVKSSGKGEKSGTRAD
jgi:ubiquinone/menaquinone biosynthesis C-methylase UbiE